MSDYDRESAARDTAELAEATRAARSRQSRRDRSEQTRAFGAAAERLRARREQASRVPLDRVVARLTVGTGEHCDLRVSGDPLVRSEHAVISVLDDESVLVEPAGVGGSLFVVSPLLGAPVLTAGRPRTSRRAVTGPTPFERGDVLVVGRSELPWRR